MADGRIITDDIYDDFDGDAEQNDLLDPYLARHLDRLDPQGIRDVRRAYERRIMNNAYRDVEVADRALVDATRNYSNAILEARTRSEYAAGIDYSFNPNTIPFDAPLHDRLHVFALYSGDWDDNEHTLFLRRLRIHRHNWRSYMIPGRDMVAVRLHYRETASRVFDMLCLNFPPENQRSQGFVQLVDNVLRGELNMDRESHLQYIVLKTTGQGLAAIEVQMPQHEGPRLRDHDQNVAVVIFDAINFFIL